MRTETKRIAFVFLIATLWGVSIVLNLNGHFVSLTKFLFYLLSILYVLVIVPDIRYLIKKKGLDSGARFQMFLRNAYRYFFFFFSLFIVLESGSNLFFMNNGWFEKSLCECLGVDESAIRKNGLLFIRSYKISNSETTEFDILTCVLVDTEFKRIRVYKADNQINCELN